MRFTSIELGVTLEAVKDKSGEIWFSGKEVAEALGYVNTRQAILRHVRDKYKKRMAEIIESTTTEIIENSLNPSYCESQREEIGLNSEVETVENSTISAVSILDGGFFNGRPNRIYIKEPGVYSLIFRSQLDNAMGFQDWVCEEVLPSIRKTGGYTLTPQKPSDDLIFLTSWIKTTFPGTLISVTPHFAVDTREKLKICESIGWEIGQPEITIHCPSGSNTSLVIFCTSDRNTEKWMEYHKKCSNKVLEISHSGMEKVMKDIDKYFKKVIRKCEGCSRRFKDCRTIVNHMSKEQQGWGHEKDFESVLERFVHCGRCKACDDVLDKNKCFICTNHYIYDRNGNRTCVRRDEDYTFSTRDKMIEHIQITHNIDIDIINRCITEVSTPKTKVVL